GGIAVRTFAVLQVERHKLRGTALQPALQPTLQHVRMRTGNALAAPNSRHREGQLRIQLSLLRVFLIAHRAPGCHRPKNREWFGSCCLAMPRSRSTARNLIPATAFSSAIPKRAAASLLRPPMTNRYSSTISF